MLVSQTNPVGVELFSYANAFFSSKKFAWMLATLVKTLWMSIIRLPALTLDRKFVISHWFPCGADGQVDGRTSVRSRDYQSFSDG